MCTENEQAKAQGDKAPHTSPQPSALQRERGWPGGPGWVPTLTTTPLEKEMDSHLTGRLSVGFSILPAKSSSMALGTSLVVLSHGTLASPPFPSSRALDTFQKALGYLSSKVDIKTHCCPGKRVQWVKALVIKSDFDPQDPLGKKRGRLSKVVL